MQRKYTTNLRTNKPIPTKSSYMDRLIGEAKGVGAPDQQYEQTG